MARVVVVVLVLVAGTATALVAASQTAWFRNWLRGYIVAESRQFLNGDLSIAQLDGNLFSGLTLENVAIRQDGAPVVSIDRIALDYSLYQIATRSVTINTVYLTRPVLHLKRDQDGWSIARLIKRDAQEADRQGPQYPIDVDAIQLEDGEVTIEDAASDSEVRLPRRISDLDAALTFRYEPVRYSLEIKSASLTAEEPALTVSTITGGVAVKDDTVFVDKMAIRTAASGVFVDGAVEHYLTRPSLKLRASSDALSFAELSGFVPSLSAIDLTPAFSIAADGPLDRLTIAAGVRSTAGTASAKLETDLLTPAQAVSGEIAVQHVNLAPLLNDDSRTTDITGTARLDLGAETFSNLDSLHGTVSVAASDVRAMGYAVDRISADGSLTGRALDLKATALGYGVDATAAGRVNIPAEGEPFHYDLRGRAGHVNLRRLPRTLSAPMVTTNVNASYHAVGVEPAEGRGQRTVAADLVFEPSEVPGARVDAGSSAHLDLAGGQLAYRADALLSNINLPAVGEAFDTPTLTDPRLAGAINGHVVAEGRGTTVDELQLTARGDLRETTIAGGQIPELAFTVDVADRTAHITADGRVSDLDPALLSGKPEAKGKVAGHVAIDATLDDFPRGVTADTVAGIARVDLEPSEVGGFAIAGGRLDADYRNQIGTVRTLTIEGPDVHVTAAGTLALNETGDSNLTFHADSPRLAELGRILEQPIDGIAQVDGTLTGNRRALKASGTMTGSNLRYEDNGALSVNGRYTVTVPDLTFDRAIVETDSQATFVTLGGQEINEVAAQVNYVSPELQFSATAKQRDRQLNGAGSVILHPDHQEIHLRSLDLAVANQRWALDPAAQPTIRYGASVEVDGVRLVNGDQALSADGRFGAPGDQLKVVATNVDLAAIDAILLRPPQFSGRLNASGVISGTREKPEATGDFSVNGGGFRQFTYESFGGTATLANDRIALDARLQQNASQWITAKGTIPLVALRTPPAPADGSAQPSVEPPASDQIDLLVDSSPLGLGLIQGFTTALTDVQGTFEAHVRVQGTAADPHPTGTITVADGAMNVAATGVAYSHMQARVDLQPDRVRIGNLTVLDNHDASLSLVGDLAVHQGAVGSARIWVSAEDFKIIDNKIGNVRVQSAMELVGELRSPEVTGYLGITTGRINLDELLAFFGPSVYSTEQIKYEDTAAVATGDAAKPASAFDALKMNVHFMVPNDLIIRADSLQTAGAPVALGALNVTLGGDLTIAKDIGAPVRLLGTVNTVRGTYDFQGRRFDIQRDGSIRFEGTEELNPRLDIRTVRLIQGVEARVNVRGTLQSPEIALSSTPPLEEADILSLIVFNQPINQLGEGDQVSLAARAQSLAAGAVVGQLTQSIGSALNLDIFEVDVAPDSGGGPNVTVGQQLGQSLYLKVQQGIGDDSSTNLIVEYELNRWLRLQSNFMQGSSAQQSMFRRRQGSGVDLIVLFTW